MRDERKLAQLRQEFQHKAYLKRLRQQFEKQVADETHRARLENVRDDISEFVDMVSALATAEEIAEFRAELDAYDAATVAALQENARELEDAQRRLNEHLSKAHVLPDGRRVFKTLDGTRVFDEHGVEVAKSTVRPDEIPGKLPRWEIVEGDWLAVKEKQAERSTFLDYQSAIDEARERLKAGEISHAEFSQLRDTIRETAPEKIREHLPDKFNNDVTPRHALPVPDLNIPDNAVPSEYTPG